jgi:hypothetical protein
MTRLILSTQYLLLFACIMQNTYSLFSRELGVPTYIWVLSFLPSSVSPLKLGLSLFILASSTSLAALFRPNKKLRGLSFIFFLSFMSFVYSFGKINHSYHAWIFSSFFFIFINEKEELFSGLNIVLIKIMQTSLLLPYLCSGLWKLRDNGSLYSYQGILDTNLNFIAYAVAQGTVEYDKLRQALMGDYSGLLVLGYLGVLIFQLGCSLAIIRQKGFILFGVMVVLFHLTSGIVLGVWFFGTTISALFLLILIGSLEKQSLTANRP